MSIEKRKKDFERCSLNMQFYCLDPDPKKYEEICKFTRIKMDIGESFDVWKKSADGNHNEIRNSLLKKLKTNPTPQIVDNVWYMFFATGDTDLLIQLYEACGSNISKKNSEMFMDMFIQFTLEYKKRINQMKEKTPCAEKIMECIDTIIYGMENTMSKTQNPQKP